MMLTEFEKSLTALATDEHADCRVRAAQALAAVLHDLQEENKRLWRAVNDLATYHN